MSHSLALIYFSQFGEKYTIVKWWV